MNELVLLIEPHGHQIKIRPWTLQQPVNEIIERCHIADNSEWIRTWRCDNGERALTSTGDRVRVFREVLPPAPKEPDENPIFQETVLKEPLKFYDDETPNGFRRKHLRKA